MKFKHPKSQKTCLLEEGRRGCLKRRRGELVAVAEIEIRKGVEISEEIEIVFESHYVGLEDLQN